jgi:hypothetical protein
MQSSLEAVANELGVLGIDVQDIVGTAAEANTLFQSLQRLDESAGRVHQRVTELNKRLLNGQNALLDARKTAAPGTSLAKALRGLAGLRQKQVTQAKRVRTTSKKAKKKAAQGSAAKS